VIDSFGQVLGHVSDTQLKAGDPLVMGRTEYTIESVKARDDAGPVYYLKEIPIAQQENPPAAEKAAEKPPAAPRRSMFRKGA
jgi:hypothetical protein